VHNSVDVYIDRWATRCVWCLCRQVPTDVVHFIDPEYVAFAVLRDFSTIDLAKTGDPSASKAWWNTPWRCATRKPTLLSTI